MGGRMSAAVTPALPPGSGTVRPTVGEAPAAATWFLVTMSPWLSNPNPRTKAGGRLDEHDTWIHGAGDAHEGRLQALGRAGRAGPRAGRVCCGEVEIAPGGFIVVPASVRGSEVTSVNGCFGEQACGTAVGLTGTHGND